MGTIDPDDIERATNLLRRSRHAVALTGAGISTPSGIPDFRSPEVGLWEQSDPMASASIQVFRRDPQAFYDWLRPLAEVSLQADPNPAHRALARLEQAGVLKTVVTQNIDGLHQRAGSENVVELHGDMREAACTSCGRTYRADQFIDDLLEAGEVPRCPECGGVLKPNIVLFGEQLPTGAIELAFEQANQADVLLVAGSSLEVTPASMIPRTAYESGADVIVVNLTPTYIDRVAEVVIRADVAEALPRIAEACLE